MKRIGLLLALASLMACGTSHYQQDIPPAVPDVLDATVVIQNYTPADVVVYVVRQGSAMRDRIARVAASTTESYDFRRPGGPSHWYFVASYGNIMAANISRSPVWTSESMHWMQPGDCVELTLQAVGVYGLEGSVLTCW